jgi:hypothetical protein
MLPLRWPVGNRFLDKIFSPGHNFRVPQIDGTCLL